MSPALRRTTLCALTGAALMGGLGPLPLCAEDDPLPPLAPGRNAPPPLDWSAWASVLKLRGESNGQVETSYEWSNNGYTQMYNRSWSSIRYELEPDSNFARHPKVRRWLITAAQGRGGQYGSSRKVNLHSETSGQTTGTYTGPMSLRTKPALALDLVTGKWSFATLSETGAPWKSSTTTRIREWNRAEDVQTESQSTALESSWIEAVAPRQVALFTGTLRVDLSAAAGKTTYGPGPVQGYRIGQAQFWPEWNDVEVLVEIENYAQWRPRGNLSNVTDPGPVPLTIAATLRPKKPNPTPAELNALPPVRRFRFELADTSREPGVCLNWPVFGADASAVPKEDPDYDLRFEPAAELATTLSPRKQKAGVVPTADNQNRPTAWVRLNCYDFGAHADLRVIAELADGREVVGFIDASDGPRYTIKIPERTDGSLIAKNWRDAENVTAPDAADDDAQPKADGQVGDGFSVYEEYRGFRMADDHIRLKPDRKDLFISNRIGPRLEPGLKLFSAKTADPRGGNGFALHHRLHPFEMPESREINANRSQRSPRTAKEFQHALIFRKQTEGDSGADFGAKKKMMDRIDWRPKNVVAINLRIDLDERDTISTTAHELSHSVGARHHGRTDARDVIWKRIRVVNVAPGAQPSYYFREWPAKYDAATDTYDADGSVGQRVRLFQESGAEIDPNSEKAATFFATSRVPWVARQGGQHSGHDKCWMRYDCADAYIPPARPDHRVMLPKFEDPNAPDDELPGFELCDGPQGTGVNDPSFNRNRPRYGPATRGNCREQMCVRDDAPDKLKGK